MEWKRLSTGVAAGVAVALAVSALTTVAVHGSDSNLFNFGPGLMGAGLVALEIAGAVIGLIIAVVYLFRHRWKHAGFALAFGVTVLVWYTKVLLY